VDAVAPSRRGAPHHILYHTTRDRARTHATVHDTGDRGKITAEGSAYGTGIMVGWPGGSGTTERRWKGPAALPALDREMAAVNVAAESRRAGVAQLMLLVQFVVAAAAVTQAAARDR
jgi:hypothetical protein